MRHSIRTFIIYSFEELLTDWIQLKEKDKEYQKLIVLLEENNCSSCLAHLTNAYPNMFTNFKNQWQGKSTSLTERLMRTINLQMV